MNSLRWVVVLYQAAPGPLRRLMRATTLWLPASLWERLRSRLAKAQDDLVANGSLRTTAALQVEPGEIRVDVSAAGDAVDVLILPVIDWELRRQRPQHLAEGLAARGHRVFYLSLRFLGIAEPRRWVIEREVAPGVYEVRLGRIPQHRIYTHPPSTAIADQIAGALDDLLTAVGSRAATAVLHYPYWSPVVDRLPSLRRVYDLMDLHSGFGLTSEAMEKLEAELIASADSLVVSAAGLVPTTRPDAVLIRNAAAAAPFLAVPPRRRAPDEPPLVGYYGAIAGWFDADLLLAVARRRPDLRFELVGDVVRPGLEPADLPANVSIRGEVPFGELPDIVAHWDVATIPFIINPLTEHTDPVKVYEYLAAGRPVVSTRLPEIERLSDVVIFADDAESFSAALDAAIAVAEDPKSLAVRRARIKDETWSARSERFSKELPAELPRISVVILSYCSEALTRLCLESVLSRSRYPGLQVIVVDNGSNDGSPDYLRGLAEADDRVKIVLEEENLGFAAGNNRGIQCADGEILVLLNNDTQVFDGWLHCFVAHFAADPELGLLGPVTDNIGNEARIPILGGADLAAVARDRADEHRGQRFVTDTLAFFCVAIPRVVIDDVGLLDEGFGLGFFEDDDYCRRVRATGRRIAIADDLFIHHELSASFDRRNNPEHRALFERSRAYYESKWGPWQPHRYRSESA